MKILTATDPPAFLDLDAPTVAAHPVNCRETDRLHWLVHCPHCGDLHYHGPQEGHRHAHCIVPTVESMRGYNLELADAWREIAIRDS
ncbi:MAG: hypothetical protein AAF916_01220 [Planctomycetota bacterium]